MRHYETMIYALFGGMKRIVSDSNDLDWEMKKIINEIDYPRPFKTGSF